MASKRKDWVSTTYPREVVALIDEVVDQSPAIDSRSELVRIGVDLALERLLHDNRITDPALRLRVYEYLHSGTPAAATNGRN